MSNLTHTALMAFIAATRKAGLPKGKECLIPLRVEVMAPKIEDARTRDFKVYVDPISEKVAKGDMVKILDFLNVRESMGRIRFTNLYGNTWETTFYVLSRLDHHSFLIRAIRDIITDDTYHLDRLLSLAFEDDKVLNPKHYPNAKAIIHNDLATTPDEEYYQVRWFKKDNN